MHRLAYILFFLLGLSFVQAQDETITEKESPRSRWATENAQTRTHFPQSLKVQFEQKQMSAYVIPIKGAISLPQLYILRRGIKEAIREKIDLVIIDMDTPGGDLETTLKIMDVLSKFPGQTITYVNKEAISAGSFIAIATDSIFFSPQGLMGASEAVTSTGEDIKEGMKRKIDSYLDAKVRSLTKQHPYRADVQRAMMQANFEFKIGDTVLKKSGELLTLTADQAVKTYGEPPVALLADGIVQDMEALLKLRHGNFVHTMKRLEITWSENLAKWINGISPILLGIGMLFLFIEFKTPGFGFFGIAGIVIIAIVFAGNYIAGLSGQEVFLIFGLGVLLIFVEVFFLPGMLLPGVLGVLLMLGSIVYSLMDTWSGNTISEWYFGGFTNAFMQLGYALLISFGGIVVLAKILPRSLFWDKLVLNADVGNHPDAEVIAQFAGKDKLPPIGATGVAVTTLSPTGEVDIYGTRYLARAEGDMVDRETPIIVVAQNAFQLVVRKDDRIA